MAFPWAALMSSGEAVWMVHVRCSRQIREALRGTSLAPDPLCHLPPCRVTQGRIPQSPWASVSSCNRLQIITMMPEKHLELNLANRAPGLAPGFAGPSTKWKSGLLCKMYQDFLFFLSIENFKTTIAEHYTWPFCVQGSVPLPRSRTQKDRKKNHPQRGASRSPSAGEPGSSGAGWGLEPNQETPRGVSLNGLS